MNSKFRITGKCDAPFDTAVCLIVGAVMPLLYLFAVCYSIKWIFDGSWLAIPGTVFIALACVASLLGQSYIKHSK